MYSAKNKKQQSKSGNADAAQNALIERDVAKRAFIFEQQTREADEKQRKAESEGDTDVSEVARRASDEAKYRSDAIQHVTQLKTPKSLAGTYQFVEELGHGGQAHVYLARRLSDRRLVTVKQLNIGSVKTWKEYDLFHREADVLSQLKIRGVADFYDAIECLEDDPPCSYIIQEYIEGASLAKMLKDGHRFQTSEVYDIILQMLSILKQLQAMDPPVIHRDIKPSNMMISMDATNKYKVTLIDFGAVANPQVQSGGSTVAGTYGYMPPEQLMGRPVPASDIYSLGAVAVELFSGVSPAQIPVKDFRLIFEPEVQQLPVTVVNTLRRMLEPKTENRLSDINELIDLFQKFKEQKFDINSIKAENVDEDRAMNRRLQEVSTICEPGNMDLWQHLSDKTPRKVPEFFIETLRKKMALVKPRSSSSSNAQYNTSTSDDSGCGALLIVFLYIIFFVLSVVFFAVGQLVIGLIMLIVAVATGVFAGKGSSSTQINQNVGLSYESTKEEDLLNLIKVGRKTVARIVEVTYLPIHSGNDVEYKHELTVVNCLPSFLVKYTFNPPDDARSEDLVHEFVSHAAPENQYAPGDPLPILYRIDKKYFGDSVCSMPYPYPVLEANSAEVVFRSDSAKHYFDDVSVDSDDSVGYNVKNSYDYRNHYSVMLKAANNREMLKKSIEGKIWLIDDLEVAKLTLKFADRLFSNNDYEMRACMVVSLLKIFHFAKVQETKTSVIRHLIRYFAGGLGNEYVPSKAEIIAVIVDYLYNDLPSDFWDVYVNCIENMDQSAFSNRYEWMSYRTNEIPRRVRIAIDNRTGNQSL